MSGTSAYLRRLGLDRPLPPTLATLVLLHRTHLARVPYENLAIMLGRPPSVDPAACLERVSARGRAGYCLHQNAVLEAVLLDLGYDVERRHGHVWSDASRRGPGPLNHLVLVVAGLPTPDNPDGRWWPDVGLGDGFRDPLPLVAGEHRQDGFTYRLADVTADGWTFVHDPAGCFGGVEVTAGAVDPAAVRVAHAELSTPPSGHFARLLVVQRRHESGVDTVRGCLLLRTGPDGTAETELTTYDEWRAALAGPLALPLDDLPAADLRALWERTRAAHAEWVAAGRP